MIKFFRKIRFDLMEKNKTGKYLKYAIGEIVLVVIGILVALSINNWNEDRKSDIVLNNYLGLMGEELQQDKLFYTKLISENKRRLDYLMALSSGSFENLNLELALENIAYNFATRNFGSAYYALKENGKLISINNKELRNQMVHYYEDLSVDYNQYASWHRNFVVTNIENYTTEHIPLDIEGNTNPSIVINEMKNNKLSSIVTYQISNFKDIVKKATENIQAIEELYIEIGKIK
jgi:hypothetical protein